jgi:hypothetical protein
MGHRRRLVPCGLLIGSLLTASPVMAITAGDPVVANTVVAAGSSDGATVAPSAASPVTKAPQPADDANTIVVYGRAINLIGVAQSGSQGTIGYEDFQNRPLSRVGELVENVPGLIATQHSGSGKANQYFLRGFNLDHGTDLAGFVDGVPINMRTHGHGQGYMDLNFLIPELVEKIDYRKGPYFADVGDFSAAGTVMFRTVDTLASPIAEAQVGMYGYYRGLVAGSFGVGDGNLLLGVNGTLSNGPWVLDEKLKKINGLAKYSQGTADHGFNIELNAYRSTWQATDQVPERAIDSGLIGRFGNIDPYLGGETTRLSLSGTGHYGNTEVSLYGLYYKFRLTSNFTYFLIDPVHGDEFQQKDERGVFGGRIKHDILTSLFGRDLTITIGGDARYDDIGTVGLYHSEFGRIIGTVRQDKVDEYSGGLYAEGQLAITDRLRATVGLRGDVVGWNVRSDDPRNSGKGHDSLGLPKVALAWRATDHIELYADYGQSYHSNDVRGATVQFDPGTDTPAGQTRVLARATGYEVGGRVDLGQFNATLVIYHLKLASELVFGGDSGTTEPQGATRRYGGEASLFWRPLSWLTLDGSGGVTHARFIDAPGQDRIPNSVGVVVAGGGTIALTDKIAFTARVRHFASAPLIEDDSARSRPTTLVNAGAYWQIGRTKLAVDVLNLFDARDNDITYFYASRLQGEPAGGVDDYHLHPVEPRQVRVTGRYSF